MVFFVDAAMVVDISVNLHDDDLLVAIVVVVLDVVFIVSSGVIDNFFIDAVAVGGSFVAVDVVIANVAVRLDGNSFYRRRRCAPCCRRRRRFSHCSRRISSLICACIR